MSKFAHVAISIVVAVALLAGISVAVIAWQNSQPRQTLSGCTVTELSVEYKRRSGSWLRIESSCGEIHSVDASLVNGKYPVLAVGGVYTFHVRGYDWETPTLIDFEREDKGWLIQ